MQSRIKHLLKHFALVLKAKLNQLKPFVRFVFQPSTLLHPPINQFIKGLHTQTFFTLLYASFSCPYIEKKGLLKEGEISASNSSRSLYQKVNDASQYLYKEKIADETILKAVKLLTKERNSIGEWIQ